MIDTMKMSHIYKALAAIIPILIPAQVSQKLSNGRQNPRKNGFKLLRYKHTFLL
jgi:hypothetical protein